MATKTNKTMLYFAPHQDDELLSMGIHICTSIQKGCDVHVILCSDGAKSGVRNTLHDGKECKKHDGLHQYDLTIEEFIQARDQEFTDSCLALGVSADHIHIDKHRGEDGALAVAAIENLITEYIKKYGTDATVCTISPSNGPKQHRDHKALGQAVANLVNKNVIRKAFLFIEPYHYADIVENPRLIPVEATKITADGSVSKKIQAAIDSYSYWNPDEHRYAVGYHSVTTEFDDFLSEKTCYFFAMIKPENMTRKERLEFRHQKFLKFKHYSQRYYSLSQCESPDLGTVRLVSVLARDTAGYQQFCKNYHVPATDKNNKRIADGSSFWCLVNTQNEVLSTGWVAFKHHFYIGEPDYDFDMQASETAILYDFATKPEHRGNGYYPLLLRSIVSSANGPSNFIIYTALDNAASHKGILKAGFQFDGALKVADHTLRDYLKAQGFTSVKHKYQLGGLRVLP